ncbi:MAG: DUF6057 family protein [Mediterranea sp.]|nr:DUF6057 family protein [Mediterranea sp.]
MSIVNFLPLPLAVGLFFGVFYKYHLFYQEQMQLFQNTGEYFCRRLAHPGGLAAYLGEYLTQFFYSATLGTLVLVLLALVLQGFVVAITHTLTRKSVYTLLTALPSLAFFILFCNENVLLSGIVALILSAAAASAGLRIKTSQLRMVFYLLMIPVLYWLAGSSVLLFALTVIPAEWLRAKKSGRKSTPPYALTATGLFLLLLSPLCAKVVLPNYPWERFLLAGNYYRYVSDYTYIFYALFVGTATVPLLIRLLSDVHAKKKRLWLIAMQFIVLAGICTAGVRRTADWGKEEIMHYDYLSRTENWNALIALGQTTNPDNPLTVPLHNLALELTGNLPEHAFGYFQKGGEGLLPTFRKEYINAVVTGDIYYKLGMINAAQYFAFEAMELIPDYRKSVRCIKRLAETNLINANYRVAEKYLRLLQNTLFYKQWATETLHLTSDEERINAHPVWGVLRKYRPQESFLFYEKDKTPMLESVARQEPTNRPAYDYLLMYTLLQKDLQRFYTYYRESNTVPEGTTKVPRAYREALAYVWSLTNFDPARRPPGVDREILDKLEQYRQVYIAYDNSEPMLRTSFGNTYWYYFHFR